MLLNSSENHTIKMNRLLFTLVVFVALTRFVAAAPNILLIVVDDMGYSDPGCFGGEIETPNLDSLAKNGLRFTSFYNTARCWSTRTALMTGYYPQQVRSDPIQRGSRLPKGVKTMAQHLRWHGYHCYHSGKWHVPGAPKVCADGGFNRSYELLDHDRNFCPKNHRRNDEPLPPIKFDPENPEAFYTTSFIARETIDQLREHAEKAPDRPFFAFTAFTSPHFPLHAPQAVIDKYRERYKAGWETVRAERYKRMTDMKIVHCPLSPPEREVGPPYSFKNLDPLGPGEAFRPIPWDELTETQREFQAVKMAIHAAMVDVIDREIGNILDQLRAMNAFENTLILFLSDNGCSAEIMNRGDGHDPDAAPGSAGSYLCLGPGWSTVSNTPFRRHKVWTLEGGISTPLIVSWPKGIDPSANGGIRHDRGHVVDLLPTVLDVAGHDFKQSINEGFASLPGKSLFGSIIRKDNFGHHSRDPIYFSHEGNRALRTSAYKLVSTAENRQGDGRWRLYDMRTDRSEQNDLSETMPEKVDELRRRWEELDTQFKKDAEKP